MAIKTAAAASTLPREEAVRTSGNTMRLLAFPAITIAIVGAVISCQSHAAHATTCSECLSDESKRWCLHGEGSCFDAKSLDSSGSGEKLCPEDSQIISAAGACPIHLPVPDNLNDAACKDWVLDWEQKVKSGNLPDPKVAFADLLTKLAKYFRSEEYEKSDKDGKRGNILSCGAVGQARITEGDDVANGNKPLALYIGFTHCKSREHVSLDLT